MISFLFEQYGYYPKDFENNEFNIGQWRFKLIEIDGDEAYVDKIQEYIDIVKNNFNKGAYIIKTRNNKKISFYDNKKYVLISICEGMVGLNDLNKMHLLFKGIEDKLHLNKLLSAWKFRSEFIEKNALSSLRLDSIYYGSNLEIVMFVLGLCQNALQYLNDVITDYGEVVDDLTITHKRLDDLSSFTFYNPFNYVVDHPLRDLAELYKSDLLDFGNLLDCLQYYFVDTKTASIFVARLLYPAKIFDLLEENIDKKDKNFKIQYCIEKELIKIKKVYEYFFEKYNIRPIAWLN